MTSDYLSAAMKLADKNMVWPPNESTWNIGLLQKQQNHHYWNLWS